MKPLGYLVLAASISVCWAAEPVEFNRDIRPILSDRCFTCHGPDAANRKTKLRFDIESGAAIDLGKGKFAIVPGNPEASELYRRITSESKTLRMPPAYAGHDKLPARSIELVRNWIQQGAKWQNHWSLIAPGKAPLPELKNKTWPRNPIDAFVLKKLEADGMRPSPEASKATLIRRVSLDITGLPPAPAEVDAFLQDTSPDAYEKVVDRLFASPRHAERMAIRWLEAARYADTNGYQADGPREMWRWRDWVIAAFERNMPFDRFTIEQIAGDLLPNPTLDQRIATAFHRNHRTNAEGGIVEEEYRVEYVADRAETTSTVFLGLTMGCARCHDHKYDPIPQKDFYRMFAYFNNVPLRGLVYNYGNEEPFIQAPLPDQARKLNEFRRKVEDAEKHWASLQPAIGKGQRAWEKDLVRAAPLEWTVPDGQVLHYSLDGGSTEKVVCDGEGKCDVPLIPGQLAKARGFNGKHYIDAGLDVAKFNYQDPYTLGAWIKPTSPNGAIFSRAEDYFEGQGYALYLMDGKLRLNMTFRWTDYGARLETVKPVEMNRWQHVLVTYDGKRKAASGIHIYVNGEEQDLKIMFDELNFPYGPKEPFRIGAGGGLRFEGAIDDVRAYNIALTPEQAATVPLLGPLNALAAIPPRQRSAAQEEKLRLCYLDRFAPAEIRAARQAVADAKIERQKYSDTIPTLMVMVEGPPRDAFVLKRGAYDAHGEKVTPGTPSALPPVPENWPKNRLGLAKWLVDRSNPLTARVTVNRFWQMYFGTGLVKTVEDFGSQGEWPIHPELLDWLAAEFMDNGWDMRKIQKTIVMSATYRQSSKVTPELMQKDPENRLLARGPRYRLPAEMIRDQALDVAGLLVEKLGGPSVKPYQPPGLWQELSSKTGYVEDKGEGLYRRSLYSFWKRTIAPPSMMNFDSPSREVCIVRESRTNTPLQALDLMNDVAYVEAARKLAERILSEGGPADADRIAYAYRLVLARRPQPRESDLIATALHKLQDSFRKDGKAAADFVSHGASARNPKFDTAELAAYTGVASLILNLDEAVTKE